MTHFIENREKIHFIERLINAVDICAEIQNKGLATVFIRFSGHVLSTDIALHVPLWVSGVDPDYKFEIHHSEDEYFSEQNLKTINELQDFLNKGKLSEESENDAIRNKEKQARRLQYEQLKKEFELTNS